MTSSSMQFHGPHVEAYVIQNGDHVQGNLVCAQGTGRLVLEPQHIRALAAALDAFEAARAPVLAEAA